MALLSALSRWLSRVTLAFSAAGMIAMTAVISWQVFARYVLQNAPAWAEQSALVLMMWFVLLAAAVGVRERFHIAMTAATNAFPPGVAHASRYVALGVILIFGASMAYWGADLVMRTWSHQIPTLGIPRGFAYLPLPLSGALITLFALELLIADLTGREVEKLWN